jgi:hypothetical protein
MIKVRIPFTYDSENVLGMHTSFTLEKPQDRPSSAISIEGSEIVLYGVLIDPFFSWFKEYNISYELDFSYPWSIIFEKESDAVLFKLVWGNL